MPLRTPSRTALPRLALGLGLAALSACGEEGPTGASGLPLERPEVTTVALHSVKAPVLLRDAVGFSDEAGGALFVRDDGTVVRLRLDGTPAAFESHPGNPLPPSGVRAVHPLGPHAALLDAENGLFTAQSGWALAPPWREALAPLGLLATASAPDGTSWLAHDAGLFRLRQGALSGLDFEGRPLQGVTSLALVPSPEGGARSVYGVREGRLLELSPETQDGFTLRDATPGALLPGETLREVAATGGGPGVEAALWLLSDRRLLYRRQGEWGAVALPSAPTRLLAAGSALYVQGEGALFRFEGTTGSWQQAEGFGPDDGLLAADASGAVWVRRPDGVELQSVGPSLRVSGLSQGADVVTDGLQVHAVLPPFPEVEAVSYRLDEGPPVAVQGPSYSLGGVEADGAPRGLSLGDKAPGGAVLTVEARFAGGAVGQRRVPFDFRPLATGTLGFAADIAPLFEARCAKCHRTGPGRDLASYERWKENLEPIVSALRDGRMPADGPLDASQLQTVQRWASAGAKP